MFGDSFHFKCQFSRQPDVFRGKEGENSSVFACTWNIRWSSGLNRSNKKFA